jgi:hypothetical protein
MVAGAIRTQVRIMHGAEALYGTLQRLIIS